MDAAHRRGVSKMQIIGFKVGDSEKSLHFVAAIDAATKGIRGLYLPLSKISFQETDGLSVEIDTKDGGIKVGFPGIVTIDDEFAARIKLL